MQRDAIINRLVVKCDLRRGFSHVHVFEKGTVGIVLLLLNSGAEFEERIGNILFRGFQDVDQPELMISQCSCPQSLQEGRSLTPLNAPCHSL